VLASDEKLVAPTRGCLPQDLDVSLRESWGVAHNYRLIAVLRLFVVLLKISGFTLARCWVADGSKKVLFLRAIENSRSNLSLRSALRILKLSTTRYHSWKRKENCALEDVSSCPRTSPHQLTSAEVAVVKDMVTSEEYRHVPTGTLALLAQRLGKVFASSATWYRLVRLHRWRRQRTRVHPAKPNVGIRARSRMSSGMSTPR